jgi:integrase
MAIRFYLHNKASAEGKHPINMEVRWADHDAAPPGTSPSLRLGTGKGCQAKHWLSTNRVSTKDLGSSGKNNRLNDLERAATKALDRAAALGEHVTPAQLRDVLRAIIKPGAPDAAAVPAEPEPAAGPTDTIQAIGLQYQKFYKGQLSHNYLRKITPVMSSWETFRPGTRLEELLPDAKTRRSDLVQQWVGYLLNDHVKPDGSIGVENNTVGRYIGGVRVLLEFAGLANGWLKDEHSYLPDIEPLLYEEVLALVELADLPDYLARVRDCFVFNCFTGPRYGNLATLQPSDVHRRSDGRYVLEYVQLKVKRDVHKITVPLNTIALDIWQRYHGQLPVISNAKSNEYIKLVAERAGLARPVAQVRRQGDKTINRRGPLWQFITCHTARHTFGTLLLDGGADLGSVQNNMGHADLASTRRYAKTRDQQRHDTTLDAFEKLSQSHTHEKSVRPKPSV